MRARIGWAVTLLGVLVALLGLAVMIYLGPDGRKLSGPHPVDTDGIAIVTAPKALSWAGVRMSVLAEVPANKPVFVGLGNAVDVDSYIAGTQRIEVDSVRMPWEVRTRTVKGKGNLPAAPTSLDWWLADSAGLGGASINATLPDETVRLAILAVGSSNLRGLKVTVAYGLEGGFVKGAGLALLGVGGLWLGRLLRRGDELMLDRGFAAGDEADEDGAGEFEEIEEVVYVYVDEDGVEHEISADEIADYELEPEPVPEPIPEPEPGPQSEPVIYVFIDEDGVEHQIGEDELDDYEIVEEEDRP